MSRSIGDLDAKLAGCIAEPDIKVVDLEDYGSMLVLLCSDGVLDSTGVPVWISDILNKDPTEISCADKLVRQFADDIFDNTTAIGIDVSAMVRTWRKQDDQEIIESTPVRDFQVLQGGPSSSSNRPRSTNSRMKLADGKDDKSTHSQ